MKNFHFLLFTTFALVLSACGGKPAEAPAAAPAAEADSAPPAPPVPPVPVAPAAPVAATVPMISGRLPASIGSSVAPANTSLSTNREPFKEIRAELAATSEIKIPGSPGDLKVWIGDPNYKANFPVEMTSASAVIRTSITPQTVKITPDAPDFNVTPVSMCQIFDPSGATATFQLTPRLENNGTYRVGATVGIYGQANCEGIPVPKDPTSIYVKVKVDLVPIDPLIKLLRDNIFKLISGLLGAIVLYLIYRFRHLLGLKEKNKGGE